MEKGIKEKLKEKNIKISMIAAMSEDNVIGNNGRIPWYIKEDLKHFKNITTGNAVIMGYNTYLSIGIPLPNRYNIVLTSKNISIDGCVVCHSINEAIDNILENSNVFIIGGANVYNQFMKYATKLYVTLILAKYKGDAFFPKISTSTWKCISNEYHKDEQNKYIFATYERKSSL